MLTPEFYNNNPKTVRDRFNHILSKLEVATVDNNIAKACCPVHGDKKPSLEVKIQPDDKISVKCHVGCDYRDILSALGLSPSFLYPPHKQKKRDSVTPSDEPRIVKWYQYTKKNGQHAYYTARFVPKDFRQMAEKTLDKRKWSIKGIKRVPYNFPRIAKSIIKEFPIIYVEGEKDADNGNLLGGFSFTTVAGGCGKWRDEYAEHLRDADIIFIPDNDEPGIKGVLRVAKKLRGIAKRIRILSLPVGYKEDLSDWIAAGGDWEQLKELIAMEAVFLDEAILVNRLNNKHAVIMVQGKFVIMNEEYNPELKRISITMSSKNNFIDRYSNKPCRVTKFKYDKKLEKNVEDSAKSVKSKVWFHSPQRRQYDAFCFKPLEKNVVDNHYNLWRGFAVKEINEKERTRLNCSLYYDHIKNAIAGNNDEIYNYILDWMSDAVQNIPKLPEVSIVLRGGSGAGKGTMISIFGKLFGQHFLHISNARHIVGHFNSHLKDCLILFADEAFYAGDRQHESTLKTLVTEPIRMIEHKGKDSIALPNYTRIMMASNKDWVVPMEMDDRRFFILDVRNTFAGNRAYFNAIFDQMYAQGGVRALLYDLRHRDISKADIRSYPMTQAILDNKIESLDSVGQWLYYVVATGELDDSGYLRNKTIRELYEEYRKSCVNKWPASLNGWSRKLRKFFPDLRTYQETGQSGRHYDFPPLDVCRDLFETKLGAKIEWEEYEYNPN